MCGICGVYNLENESTIERPILIKMQESINHRGPDGGDLFIDHHVGFGFNRLSFVDLAGGMQPLWNEDSTIVMVCNGEIFNYRELRNDLENSGHKFRTYTDVEVILHLYEEYGVDFVNYLNGQFAIAIYDYKKCSLLLVRDHMGIAPLFYTRVDGRLVFSSEIKSILNYPNVKRKLNLKAVDQLLTFPGIASPVTFFEDIYSLENGHLLLVQDGNIKDIEYWDVCYNEEDEDKGIEYYTLHLRELMKKSIQRRLIADVPIGFYISGGLDSAIIASFINEYFSGTEYSSFSAEFSSEKYSEKYYQAIIQQHVNSTHYSVVVKEADLWEKMRDVLYHTEMPLKETYDVAAYLLSGLVQSTNVKAILTGQGADEFFNGYLGYKFDLIRGFKKNGLSKQECEMNEKLWGDPYFQFEKKHFEFEGIKKQLYSHDLKGNMSTFSAVADSPINLERVKGLKSQRRRSYIDYKLRLTDHLLADHGDRMFFSHCIEGRHPFLDREVIDFSLKIPEKYKLAGVNEKYILKQIAKGIVPDEVINRKKFPFSAPGMPTMLKKNVELINLFLSDDILKKQGIFDVEYVNSLKRRYVQDTFELNIPYESDYLIIVLTVTIFNEIFNMSL